MTYAKGKKPSDYPEPTIECDPSTHFIYKGSCLSKTCLTQKLSRVRRSPSKVFTEKAEELTDSIVHEVVPLETE